MLLVGIRMLRAYVDDPDGATEEDRRGWREDVDFVTPKSDGFLAGFQAGFHADVEEEVLAGFQAALQAAAKGKQSGIAAPPKEDSQ